MANVYATKNGNWSDPTVWNTGALPTAADDVWSNNFVVTIDISPTVLSIRNGVSSPIVAGGRFEPVNGITLTCTGSGIVAGINPGASLFTANLTTGQSCAINSSITGGNGNPAVALNATGTINITGNVFCPQINGATNGHGVINNAGTVNIVGNLTSNANSLSSACVVLNGNGTINITGNATGSNVQASMEAITNSGTGVINMTGILSASNGPGARNTGTGTINLTGSANASNNVAYLNTGSGIFNHVGTAQASSASPAIGSGSVSQITILTGPLIASTDAFAGVAAAGVNPCVALRWFPADTALATFSYTMRGQTQNGSTPRATRTMSLPESGVFTGNQAAPANVRSGTIYGPGNTLTGTLAVPPVGSVALGVPVDATTGTATITADSIRSALGMASANLDTQLNSKPTAAQIRAELSVELERLDAAVSSRLAAAGYTAPPSVEAVAAAVWSAATRTLTTAIDNSATIAAAVWNSLTSAYSTNGTFGKRVLISSSSQREVAVTGSHHVAADIHELQPAVINSTHFAAGAFDGVRASLGMASANIDAQFDALPTAGETADAVRTELTSELAKLDAPVSGALTPSGTLARVTLVDTVTNLANAPDVPTEAEIADAVRTELAPELARLGNAATTQEVADIVEGAQG